MASKNFPKDKVIQFWTRVNCDYAYWESYDGRRLDLLHPSIYWDNQPDKYNVIVHPDPYMFTKFSDHGIYFEICSEKHKINWEEKQPIAYF